MLSHLDADLSDNPTTAGSDGLSFRDILPKEEERRQFINVDDVYNSLFDSKFEVLSETASFVHEINADRKLFVFTY